MNKHIRPTFVAARIIVFAFLLVLLCTAGTPTLSIQAASGDTPTGPGWAVVATQEVVTDETLGDLNYNAIYMINTYTHEVHGPFLMDEITPLYEGVPQGMNVFDVAITPDGKTALISDFGNSLIYFVDLSDPLAPAYLGSVEIDIFAEDLAITADGRYALVTDGGFSHSVYSIDIRNRTVIYQLYLPSFDYDDSGDPIYGYTNAVAVAADGTVVMADYFNGVIHALVIDENGRLIYYDTYRYYLSYDGEVSLTPTASSTILAQAPEKSTIAPGTSDQVITPSKTGGESDLTENGVVYQAARPVNVAIAPDGVTVLISDSLNYVDTSLTSYSYQYSIGVYKITDPGELEFVEAITGLSHAMQTINFNETGDQAVMLGNNAITYDSTADPVYEYLDDRLFVMDILGPGEVEFDPAAQSVDLLRYTSGQLFGVDGLAEYEGEVYASYPTAFIDGDLYPERFVSVVDLDTMTLTQIDWGEVDTRIPIGIGIRPYIPEMYYLPILYNE